MCRAFGKRLCVKHITQFSDLLINPDVPECFQTPVIRPNWMNWWSKWLTNSLVHDSGSPRRSWILTSVWGTGKRVPVVWVKCVVYHWTYVNIYDDIASHIVFVAKIENYEFKHSKTWNKENLCNTCIAYKGLEDGLDVWFLCF